MSGRGEGIEALSIPNAALEGWSVLLHRPEIPVPAAKTATMYRSLRSSDFRGGEATGALIGALVGGRPPAQEDCVNSFDRPAREVMQGLTDAWRNMGAAIARSTEEFGEEATVPLLAGAGPTLFTLLPSAVAARVAHHLRRSNGFTVVAKLLSRSQATEVWAV